MKNRILTGWTLSRILYLILGILIMIQALMEKQWVGIPFGGYFFLMGVFALGCAGGNCTINPTTYSSQDKIKINNEEVTFEEIK